MSLLTNLEAYFSYDGSFVDVSGNGHTGTLATGSGGFVSGKLDQGFQCIAPTRVDYSGGAGFVTLQSVATVSAFSISVWLKTPTVITKTYQPIFTNTNTTPPYWGSGVWFVSGLAGGTARTIAYSHGDGSVVLPSVTTFPSGSWNHFVFTYAGASGAWKIYVNGVLDASGSGTAIWGEKFYHSGGIPTWTDNDYEGSIDELAAYKDRELTASDVSTLYNSGYGLVYPLSSLLDGLVSYWGLEGNSIDSHGSNDGTDTAITYSTAHILDGAFGNGTSSGINVGTDASLNITGDLTVAAWVYWIGAVTNFIITRCVANGGAQSTYEFRISGSSLQLLTHSGGTVSGSGLVPGVWQHCCATRSGTTWSVYIDGLRVATATVATAPTSLPAASTLIGTRADGNNFLGNNGFALDEVGIWNRALSYEEVRNLWSVAAGYPLVPIQFYPFFASTFFASPPTTVEIPFENVFTVAIATVAGSCPELDFPSRGSVTEPIFDATAFGNGTQGPSSNFNKGFN